jgi:hypothetical protein
VLLIVNDARADLYPTLERLTRSTVSTWLTTSTLGSASLGRIPAEHVQILPMQLHGQINPSRKYRYNAADVEKRLRSELRRHQAVIDGESVGLLFDEMSTVMAAVDKPKAIVDAERHWSTCVRSAAADVGARPAWNVCMYNADALRQLSDPVAAAMELTMSHDEVWSIHGDRTSQQQAALREVVHTLRPSTTSLSTWGDVVEECVSKAKHLAA